MKVVLQASDPWDLSEALAQLTLRGDVVDKMNDRWIVQFDDPIHVFGKTWLYASVRTRYEGEVLEDATALASVSVNAVLLESFAFHSRAFESEVLAPDFVGFIGTMRILS